MNIHISAKNDSHGFLKHFRRRWKIIAHESRCYINWPLFDISKSCNFKQPRCNKVSYYSYRFTKVAVDAQVKALDGKAYDILYVGTGKLEQLCAAANKGTRTDLIMKIP